MQRILNAVQSVAMETLEQRQMLSADVTLEDGQLIVSGGLDGDVINVVMWQTRKGSKIQIMTGKQRTRMNLPDYVYINGGAGNDSIQVMNYLPWYDGNYRNITVCGGPNDDNIVINSSQPTQSYGGGGDDMIEIISFDEEARHSVYGGAGNDNLIGGDSSDYLNGGSGNDTLFGGDGNDTLFGGRGSNIADGGAGNDYITGTSSQDSLYGGDGDDTFNTGDGDTYVAVVNGGEGRDTLNTSNPDLLQKMSIFSVESIWANDPSDWEPSAPTGYFGGGKG